MRGAWGKQAAADFLRKKGYTILAQNYRTRQGEIDLIAACDRTLCSLRSKHANQGAFALLAKRWIKESRNVDFNGRAMAADISNGIAAA